MTALQRLLRYPHAAVFDKDPVAELAFRLRHADGATWSVADRVMTASAGASSFSYDLTTLTVAQLAAALQADGFDVLSLNSSLAHLSALVLVETSGDQGLSNGDRVPAFTSLLWVLLSAYGGEVTDAGLQVREALRQMVITQSGGEWLDLWGTLYAQTRLDGESDAAYAPRIPREAFRIRCNARAIELAILESTGSDVRITEPWTQIFKLDRSELSGDHRFYDGEFIGYHLIKPTARTNIDWPAVRAVIDRNRAAGVLVLGPQLVFSSHVDASVGGAVHFGGLRRAGSLVYYEDRALLDFAMIGDTSILNHAARYRRELLRSSGVLVADTYAAHGRHFRDYRGYQSGSVYLSQYWTQFLLRTWASEDDETWQDADSIIGSKHTRS